MSGGFSQSQSHIILNATALNDYGICYVLCSIQCRYVHVLIICMHTFTNRQNTMESTFFRKIYNYHDDATML